MADDPELLYVDDWQARSNLVLAVLASSLPLVRFFVEEGNATVDERTAPDDNSALFYACRDGKADIAKYLLVKGADPFQKNRNGTTLFMIAASSAPSSCYDWSSGGGGGGGGGEDGRSACAVIGCLIDAINARGGREAELFEILEAKNGSDSVALMMAFRRYARDVMLVLLAAGARPRYDYGLPPPRWGEPGESDQDKTALYGCLCEAKKEPSRILFLEKLRFLSETAHVQDLLQEAGSAEMEEEAKAKCLAAAPSVLKGRVANDEDLPRVTLTTTDGDERIREVARYVLLEGGLKPELFVEWMEMVARAWHYEDLERNYC